MIFDIMGFFVCRIKIINYFSKYLLPQLLEYFNNDKDVVIKFIPKIIEQEVNKKILEDENTNEQVY